MAEKEMTQKEMQEGIANLVWLRNNGHKLISAMLNPTWPPRKIK